jgi:hypothetical protein
MKILEAQSAVLTNYEVFTHLSELRERYAKERKNKRGKDKQHSNPHMHSENKSALRRPQYLSKLEC